MAKRKAKQPKADLVAVGQRIANAFTTANERLEYWFDQVWPDWKPEKTGLQIVHDEATQQACAMPSWTTKLDGAHRYLVAVLGYSSAEVDVMTPAELIEILKREVESKSSDAECHVTLLQMAGIVNRTKRHLERVKAKLPPPDVKGGNGQPDEWKWSEVRPILETLFGRLLPEVFPADRFVRR